MSDLTDKLGISCKPLADLVKDAQKEVSELCKGKEWRMCIPVQADDSDIVIGVALTAQSSRISGLEADIVSFDEFHPRAMKLIRKKKNLLVIAEDEPYFFKVYGFLREHEKEIGRWTDEDEMNYQKARQAYYARPSDLPEAGE